MNKEFKLCTFTLGQIVTYSITYDNSTLYDYNSYRNNNDMIMQQLQKIAKIVGPLKISDNKIEPIYDINIINNILRKSNVLRCLGYTYPSFDTNSIKFNNISDIDCTICVIQLSIITIQGQPASLSLFFYMSDIIDK